MPPKRTAMTLPFTLSRLRDIAIAKSRQQTDKAVAPFLDAGETLRWSGRPGFVATFNSREVLFAIEITAIITLIAVILTATPGFPLEINAMFTVFICGMSLLFIGWVRQIYRYILTVGMFYAVTDSRLLIIRGKKIRAEMNVAEVRSTAISLKAWGNGTIVFNKGADFFSKGNLVEAPPRMNGEDPLFAFFNVFDPGDALRALPLHPAQGLRP